jgi:hypothetical protein
MIVDRRRFTPRDRLLMMYLLSNVRARACVPVRAHGARATRQCVLVRTMHARRQECTCVKPTPLFGGRHVAADAPSLGVDCLPSVPPVLGAANA